MKPQSAKAKGRSLQNDVQELILYYFPELTENDVRSTPSGVTGVDIQLSEAALKVFPFQVECKSRGSLHVYEWYKQAQSHGDNEPLLIIKQNRSKPLAVIDLESFLLGLENANKKSNRDS